MKHKHLLLYLVFIFFGVLNYSGNKAVASNDSIPCGFDALVTQLLRDSASQTAYDSVRACIRRQVQNNQQYHTVQQPNNYVIPVVVHLIGSTVSAAVSDAAVMNQITLLNQGFANQLGSPFGVADDAQITFCLAQTTPTGVPWANFGATTNGVTRTTTAAANTMATTHNMNATGVGSQQALTNIINFNTSRYLNIWVVEQISLALVPYSNSVVGYSPFPLMIGLPNQFLDGVVMRASSFGINPVNPSPNYNQGRVLIHEIGHYLGLFHTFQFSCNEVTNAIPCNLGGDECCDTPPVFSANQSDCTVLTGANSCNENPDLPDMIENHMDYALDNANTCRNTFTDEQANRMHATIQLFRSQLVSVGNLIFTGLTGITGCMNNFIDPTFITTLPGGSTQACIGQAIGFQAVAGASTYSWTFPGGTPSTATGTNNPTGITWAAAGVYLVSLNITDGNGTNYSSSLQIFVTNCTPYAGERANWYFGTHWGISFSTGVGLPSLPSSVVSLEASAAISDNAGQLLFYTDGRSVYNSTHAVMANGNVTLNGGVNSGMGSNAQGTLIVPRPGNANHHYIFSTSDVDFGAVIQNGVSYYEVDMAQNGGLGNVLNPNAPVHPTQNYATTEPILAVPQCNGTDFWIIVKPTNNNHPGLPNPGPINNVDNLIMSYSLTSAGLANIPVVSNAGAFNTPAIPVNSNTWIGGLAVSPDKTLIAYSDLITSQTHLYNFDCASGILNYLTTINGGGYGACFSPNSRVLYTSNLNSFVQYDLSNLSPCNLIIPFKLVATVSNAFAGTAQLGPDGRVYFAINRFNVSGPVGCANFPDIVNVTNTSNDCGYNPNAVQPLSAAVLCRIGLPNDIIGTFNPMPDAFSFCVRNCSEAIFTNLGCGINFTWDFGDGYSITGPNGPIPNGTNNGTTTGNFEYPHHTYAGTGNYTVTLSVDGRPVVTHTVVIVFPPVPIITGPNPVCTLNVPTSYFGPPGYQYLWTVTNGTPLTGNLQTINISWNSLPGTITLLITDPQTGCTNTNTITVTQSAAPPTVNAGPDLSFCAGGSAQINATVSNGTIAWTPAAGLSCTTCSNPVATPTVTTTYTLTASNGCGSNSDQVTVTVNPCGFTITKTANHTQTYAGQPIQYTITVCNNFSTPQSVTLSDQLPPNFFLITTPANFPNFPGYPVASSVTIPAGTCVDFVYSGYFTANGLCPDPDHTNNVTMVAGGQTYTANQCVSILYGCPMIVYGNSDCVLGNPVPVVIGVHTGIPNIKRVNLKIVYPQYITPPTTLNATNTSEPFAGATILFGSSSITAPVFYQTISGVDYYVTTVDIVYDFPVSVSGPYSFATINFTYSTLIPPCQTSYLCWAIAPYNNAGYHVDLYQVGATTPTFSPWTQGFHIFFSDCPGCNPPDAGFTISQTQCDPHGCVTVVATNPSPTAVHIWEFGDNRATPFNGAQSTTWCYFDPYTDNFNVTQAGVSPGTYYIKHSVIDNGNYAESITPVVLYPPCCASNVVITDGQQSSSLGFSLQNTTVSVQGEFIIDQTFVFTGCTVAMEPGSKITVMPSTTLLIDNSTLEACSNMWQGIYIEPRGNCTVRNSSVNDAQYAIYAKDESTYGLYSSVFDRNFVSVFVPQSMLGINSIGQLIDNCTFTNSSSLHAPFAGQTPAPTANSFAGIQAYDVMIDVSGLGTNHNHFRRLSNGIVTSRCNVIVSNTDFTNIYPDIQYNPLVPFNGTGINCRGGHGYFSLRQYGYGSTSTSSFSNCNRGIYAQRMNVNSSRNRMTGMNYGYGIDNGSYMVIDVIDNYIYCNSFGMILRFNDHARHLLIQSNAIHFGSGSSPFVKGVDAIRVMESNGNNDDSKINGNSIYFNPGATNAANGINMYTAAKYQVTNNTLTMTNNLINRNGIVTHGCNKDEVSCNSVYGSYTAYTSDKFQSAIKVDMGDGHNVSCNTVDGTINGLYFNGYAYSTDVKGNNINTHTWGLHLSPYAIIGNQYWKGNQWYAPAVGGGVNAYYEDINNAAVYKFNFDPGAAPGPTVQPQTWYPSYWFFNQGNANFLCNDPQNGNYCSRFSRVDCPSCTREYDIRIAQERIANGTYTDESFFELARALFEKLQQNPEYRDSFPVLDSFYVANEYGLLSLLKQIDDQGNNMYHLDPLVTSNLMQNVTMIDQNHQALRSHLELLFSGTLTPAQEASERASITGLLSAISSLVSYSNTTLTLAENSRILTADNVRVVNDGLQTSALIEENEQQVTDVYLRTVAIDEDEFSPDQVQTLFTIASQCPLAGGNAVWRARAMYFLIDEEAEFDDINTCLASGISLRQSVDLLESTSIYPNPTSGITSLVYKIQDESDGEFEIYNALGMLVMKYKLDWKANEFEFSTAQFMNGVYNYKVTNKNSVIGIGKFSVIK